MFTAYTFLIHQYLEKRLVATGSKVNVSCELRHQLRCAWEIRNRRKVERTNSERRRYIGAQHVLHTESQASNVKYMVELGVASQIQFHEAHGTPKRHKKKTNPAILDFH